MAEMLLGVGWEKPRGRELHSHRSKPRDFPFRWTERGGFANTRSSSLANAWQIADNIFMGVLFQRFCLHWGGNNDVTVVESYALISWKKI